VSGPLTTKPYAIIYCSHDPYAADSERQEGASSKADAEKARGLLELARHQNVAGDTASRDDFARKMYLGLKGGKKRRADQAQLKNPEDGKLQELLAQETSSSEEEFIEEEANEKKPKGKKHDDSDDSSREERRRRKRDKRKKRKKYHRRKYDDSDDSDSSEEERRRRKRRKRKEEKKRSRRRPDKEE